MAGTFDDLIPGQGGSGLFDDLTPQAPSVGERAAGTGLSILSGAMRATKAPADLVNTVAPNPLTQGVSDFFQRGIDAAADVAPDTIKQQRARPIITQFADGDIDFQMPNATQVVDVLAESAPMIPGLVAGGQAIAQVPRALGAGKALSQAIGFGASNAAFVAPAAGDETYREALAAGMTPEQARDAQLMAAGIMAPVSAVTGAAGLGLAAKLGTGQSVLGGMARGFLADAPFEGVEEGAESAAQDIAMDRPIDPIRAASATALGAIAGGLPGAAVGAIEAMENGRDPIDPSKPAGPIVRAALAAPVLVPTTDPQANIEQQRATMAADQRGAQREVERTTEEERRSRYMDAANMDVGQLSPDDPLVSEFAPRTSIPGMEVRDATADDLASLPSDEDITLETPGEPSLPGMEVGTATARDFAQARRGEDITLESPGKPGRGSTVVGEAKVSELTPTERAVYEQLRERRAAREPSDAAASRGKEKPAAPAPRTEPEIRQDDGAPFKTLPGANAARKKLANPDDYEAKRLDKGQFVLARKTNGQAEKPAAEVAPESDGGSRPDATGSEAGSRVDAGQGDADGALRSDSGGARTGDAAPGFVGGAKPEPTLALTENLDGKIDDAGGAEALAQGDRGSARAGSDAAGSTATGGIAPVTPAPTGVAERGADTAESKAAAPAGSTAPAENVEPTFTTRAQNQARGILDHLEGKGLEISEENGQVFFENGKPDADDEVQLDKLQRLYDEDPEGFHETWAMPSGQEPAPAAAVENGERDAIEGEFRRIDEPAPNTIPPPAKAVTDAGAAETRAGQADTTPAADTAPASAPAEVVHKTKLAAGAARAKAGQKETHDIVPTDGGFAVRTKGAAPAAPAQGNDPGDFAPMGDGDTELLDSQGKPWFTFDLRQAQKRARKEGGFVMDRGIAGSGGGAAASATKYGVRVPSKAAPKDSEKGVAPRPVETGDAPVAPTPDAAGSTSGSAGEKVSAGKDTTGLQTFTKHSGFEIGTKVRTRGKDVGEIRSIFELKDGKPRARVYWPTKQFHDDSGAGFGKGSEQHVDLADLKRVDDTPPADKRTPRQIEREAFTFVVSTADLQAAAAGDRAAFDTKVVEAMRAAGYEQYATDQEFLAAAYKEAAKRHREAERERSRDPAIYQGKLAELTAAANLAEGEHADFKLGFDHALAGRTKSTITGDVKLKGYEAARTWLRTPEGRAFFEGKRIAKLENTGADLKRWFDKAKADAKAAQGEWRNVWTALDKATMRANVFRPDLADATPGTRRMADGIREALFTFKEYVAEKGVIYKYHDDTFDEAIEREFRRKEGDALTEKIKALQSAASDFLAAMETISNGLSGAKNVRELSDKLLATFYDESPRSKYSDTKGNVSGVVESVYGKETLFDFTPGKLSDQWSLLSRLQKDENTESGPSDRKKPLQRTRLEHITRTGRKDYRQGKDVTPQQFKDRFGFADVGFGTWVGGKQDQDHLNYAYDAFMDLADVLGIQPRDISLGGKLHFTIGALGQGSKAAATFHPAQPHPDGGTVPVINVTNTRGDGTVAHEWFHALDFALRGSTKTPVKSVVGYLKHRFDKASIDDAVQKFVRGGWYYSKAGISKTDRAGNLKHALQYGDYGRPKETRYKTNADTLGEDYWGNDEELFARAGESYVYDKLADTANTYLVTDWVAPGKTKPPEYRGTPFPGTEERAAFASMFDALFKDLAFDEKGPTPKTDNSAVMALLEQERSDFMAYRDDVLARAVQMVRESRPQTQRADTSDTDALIEQQRRREEQRAALEAAEREQRPAEITSDKALSEDELSALFDEAAAELRETSAEAPDAPEPGVRTVVLDKPPPGGWKDSDRVPDEYRKDGTASKLAAEAAKLGVKGATEALTGLAKLFGVRAGGIRSFPGVRIDPETYAQAKPHFQAALKAFVDAGKSIKDLFKFLIQNFGEGIKPYAVHFAREQGLGTDLAANPTAAQTANQESANVPDRQNPARDDRAGDENQGAEAASQPQGERGPASGDRTPGEGSTGVVPGGSRNAAEGGGDGDAKPAADGAGGNADDSTTGGSRNGPGGSNRVPERKRDGRNYVAPVGSLTREGSWRATAARNLDIVELVKRLQAENRQATPEEQAQLVKFTGWGASEIAQNLFPKYDTWAQGEWKPLVERRAKIMSDAERAAAARTTQYAHYTSEDVIRGIWDGVRGMGFEGGNILEPGMGVGLFAAAAPDQVMQASRYTGIEYDPFTAAIGKQLLQRENVIEGDYTKTKLPKDFFDLAIGNPPFGKIAITDDPEYGKQRFPIHDYFFAKTIDRVRPGGLVVFISSRYTMDKAGARARQYLADRADLLGAIRLPQTAFKANAGTEVVTDILFLRKRLPSETPGGAAWLDQKEIAVGDKKVLVNEYFADHPDMVLGKPALTGTMYSRGEYTVEPGDGPITDALREAVGKLPKGGYTPKSDARATVAATIEKDFNPKSKKEGTLYLSDSGNLMRVESGVGVGLDSQLDKPLAPKDAEWVRDYVPLRDAVKQAQYDQLTDGDWEKSLKALNKTYDAFVNKHGDVRAFTKIERETVDKDTGEKESTSFYRWRNAKLLFLDVESPIVEMLESISEDDKISKAPFLLGRTIKKPERAPIENVRDALLATLDERGGLDLDHIAGLIDKKRQEVIDELGDLIYEAPGAGWQMADEYLSGDVVKKLDEAEAAADIDARYQRNVQALIKVQPKALAPKDIIVQTGAAWVPMEVYEAFADEVLGESITITHVPQSNTWKLDGGSGRRSGRSSTGAWNTPDRSALEIFEAALMGNTIKITRKDSDGKTHTDQDATTAANEKLKLMRAEFARWIWTDGKRGERMSALYNRLFNNLAPRTFDGSHLTLPGLSLRYKLYPHQKRAIWRIIQTGNTYLAHAVGAGKTLEMIVSGMEMKRLGLISKPAYAVPKHMLKQFASEFLDAYPTANILVADDENFDKANRGRFVAQAALNNPDAIIITHPAFTKLGVKDESRKRVAGRFIGDLESAIAEEDDKFRRKEMEAQLERLERRFDSKAGKGSKDDVVDFEDLGVDFLFVDEAHVFRKLDFVSRRGAIKGIDPSGSARALDLFIKLQHLEEQRPGRAGVLASGTPVVNTMAELYSIMRMMNMPQIEADGLDHFDVWANQFGDVRRELEQNAAGTYEFVERFAQFVNVPELMSRVRNFMDVLTSSQLGDLVKRPDVEGNQPELVINPISDRLETYLKDVLAKRIQTSRKWKPSPQEKGNPDPLINIITDGRLAAIDMRFVDPKLNDDPDSKLNRMLQEIVAKHRAINERTYTDKESGKPDLIRGGTQIVFSAVGFGDEVAKSRGFDVRAAIVKALTEGGIRRDQIAFMGDYGTDSKKAQLFKDMRAGKVRVLFGSPANMGTGVNVQKRLSYLHFLSPPWYPADVEQPHGRIIRQGNQNTIVGLKWYATKGTYDSTMWQMVSRKAKFIESAFTGDASVRKLEDVSESSQYEMASALSSGDQRAIQLAGLNADIERLSRLRGAHEQEQSSFRGRRSSAAFSLKSNREKVARYTKAKADIGGFIAEPTLVIGSDTLTDRVKFGEAVASAMAKMLVDWKPKGKTLDDLNDKAPTVIIGKVQGKYDLVADAGAGKDLNGEIVKSANLTLVLPEDVEKAIEERQRAPENLDPGGLHTRIRNKLNSVAQDLSDAEANVRELEHEIRQLDGRIGAQFQFEQDLFDKQSEAARLKQELASVGKADKPGDGAKAEFALDDDAGGNTVDAVRGELDKAFGRKGVQNLIEKGVLVIIPDVRSLPAGLREQALAARGRVKGVYTRSTGTAYMIASNLNLDEVVANLLHEIGEHRGLRDMLGADAYARLIAQVKVLAKTNPVVRDAYDTVKRLYRLEEADEQFWREVIAKAAEQPEIVKQSWFKNLIQAVRRFLFQQGFMSVRLTDQDIAGMVAASLRKQMETGGAAPKVEEPPGPSVNSDAFKRWFGDSKVVDAEGKPVRVYHGTSSAENFDTFKIGDRGAWFGEDPTMASMYASGNDTQKAKLDGATADENPLPRVLPMYLSIQNPYVLTEADWKSMRGDSASYQEKQRALTKRVKALGHDGINYGDGVWTAFRPEQIKSAIGNRGTFDPTNESVLFALADAVPNVRERVADLFETRKTFGWWHNTVGTQYHKAQVDKDFKRVFDRGQQYLHDVSRMALGAADLAPEILPKLEKLSDIVKSGASPRELKPVADAIFMGTLEDEKVYTDVELTSRYKLNPKQIRLYRQARAAIDRSLEDVGVTDMVKLARSDLSEEQARRAAASPNTTGALAYLSSVLEGKDSLVHQLAEKAERVAELKSKGYAPLMRFGRYTVSQTNGKGEQLYFGLFEDEADARKMERELREQDPQTTVERGVMSTEAFKLFKGISPDTLEIFAAATGQSDNDAFQDYLKLAINNRSALKRLIRRKGIAGYSPDLKRVLAQFITSNARAGSGNLHRGEMLRAANDIPREKGDVKDEAVRLLGFVQDPQEEASGLRSFLFFNFLGGSVASAAVNMTQPVTMTLPYLAQWGLARAAREVRKAFGAGLHRPIAEPALRAAMDRAIKDGVVEPHQIFELQGAAMQSETDWGKADKLREGARKVAFAWGRLFSMAEAFNRRLSFAAAFQIGRSLSAAQLKAANVADAYEFAVKAVEETQGIYNRGNRPDWARGAVGATVFTFKQFSIAYLEFLKRLPRRERVLALGVLFLAAGANGLPGIDDLDDLIDTLAQHLGYSWNTKQERDEIIERAVAPVLGAGGAEFARNGVSAFLPIDVQARMGLQNLIPGTGVALKSKQDKGREVAEAIGPAAGLVQGYFEGAGRVIGGDVRGAVVSAAPVAVQNAIKALDMASLGFYRDSGGRRVVDTDAVDAAWKAIGFQPRSVAESSRRRQTLEQNRALNVVTESEIADLWAQGIFEKDPAKVNSAKSKLADWNRRNPESRIRVVPNQILRRVKEMGLTADQRYLKRTPPELRAAARAELSQ